MTHHIPPAAVRGALELHVGGTLGLHVGGLTLAVKTPEGKSTIPATCRLRLAALVGGRWVEVEEVRGLVEVVADGVGVPAVNGAGGA